MSVNKPDRYVGVDNDVHGGMTTIGRLVRDAQVFGLIPDEETCAGWNLAGVDALLQKVNVEWDKYGCLPSHLPVDLLARYEFIHTKAFATARAAGWSGELETEDEQ
ncbi:MAG: hypothetical protein V3U65_05635 [Granulosicoccaceae bacterium]